MSKAMTRGARGSAARGGAIARRGAAAGGAELGMMMGGVGLLLIAAGTQKRAPMPVAPVVHQLPFGRVLTAAELAGTGLPGVEEIAGDYERQMQTHDPSDYFYPEDEPHGLDDETDAELDEAAQGPADEPLQLGDGSERLDLEQLIIQTEGIPARVGS